MSDVVAQFWDFEDAPLKLRRLFAKSYTRGWLALILYDRNADFAINLAACWRSSGLCLEQSEDEAGRIVLAGEHPGGPKGWRELNLE